MKKSFLFGIMMLLGSVLTLYTFDSKNLVEAEISNQSLAIGDDVAHVSLPYLMTVQDNILQNGKVKCNFIDNQMVYQEKVFDVTELKKIPKIKEYVPMHQKINIQRQT